MQTYQQTFTGPTTWEINVPGAHFRLLDAPVAVTVRLFKGGSLVPLGVMSGLLAGLWARPQGGFDRVQIDIPSAGTYQFGVSDGSSGYDRAAGSVALTNMQGAFTQAQRTVTSASAQLQAANAARRYLMIQNKSATGDIFVNLAGAAATTANGLLIPAGGSYEINSFCPTGAIFAIGSIASNPDVVVAEG